MRHPAFMQEFADMTKGMLDLEASPSLIPEYCAELMDRSGSCREYTPVASARSSS